MDERIRKSFRSLLTLPILQLCIILLITIGDSLLLSSQFPFIPFMVKSFHVTSDPHKLGYYVGICSAASGLGAFISNFFWGKLSDLTGRRPVILFGLVFTSLFAILFGLSSSFLMALLLKFAFGFFSSIVTSIKSSIRDITSQKNRAIGFALFNLFFSVGMYIGPLLGGVLSNPCHTKLSTTHSLIPSSSVSHSFFCRYPYFLPCLVAGSLNFLSASIAFFVLPESFHSQRKRLCCLPSAPPRSSAISKWKLLVTGELPWFLFNHKITTNLSNPDSESQLHDKTPLLTDKSDTSLNIQESKTPPKTVDKGKLSFLRVCLNPRALLPLILYLSFAFVLLCFDSIIPVWALLPAYNQTSGHMGGIGWGPGQIGISRSTQVVSLFLFQLLIFPILSACVGALNTFRIALAIALPLFICYPFLTFTPLVGPAFTWAVMILLSSLRTGVTILGYTPIMVLISDSVPSDFVGRITGLSQSLASFARAISPMAANAFFAWSSSDSHSSFPRKIYTTFIILAILDILVFGMTFWKSLRRLMSCLRSNKPKQLEEFNPELHPTLPVLEAPIP